MQDRTRLAQSSRALGESEELALERSFRTLQLQVTLHFAEIFSREPGKRVFHVSLEGKRVIENLDISAKVGQCAALPEVFPDVPVTDGQLDIDFHLGPADNPKISAIEIERVR